MAKTFDLSIIFKAIDKVSRPARKMINVVGSAAGKVSGKILSIGKTMVLGFGAAIAGLGALAIKSAADMETLTVAFESMLGSGEAATKMVEGLVNFTARTPFQLKGVGQAAKQLLGFGIAADNIEGTLKFLGDIAAGANVPLTDMAAIFGKVKAKGKAMTEELLQLSDRGVPIIDVLARGFNTTGENVFKMASQGKISFEIMQQALESLTKEGGIFENQMAKQSRTVAGIFSTLKDNVSIALGTVGKFLIKMLDLRKNMNRLIVVIQKATEQFKVFAEQNADRIKASFDSIIRSVVETSKAIFKWVSDNRTDIMDFIKGIFALIKAMIWLGKVVGTVFNVLGKLIGTGLAATVTKILNIVEEVTRGFTIFIDGFKAAVADISKTVGPLVGTIGKIARAVGSIFGRPAPATAAQNIVSPDKQQTDIRIQVASDKDSQATVEQVKNVKGDANVQVATDSYVGAFM